MNAIATVATNGAMHLLQGSLFRRLHLATLSVAILAAQLLIACNGARCGVGTVLENGVCVVDPGDGSNDANDAVSMGDVMAGDADLDITEIRLSPVGPWASRNDRDPVIPVGGIVEFVVTGLNAARQRITLPASVLSVEGASILGRPREATASAPSRLSVVGMSVGMGRVIARVDTPRGQRSAELFVYVEAPASMLTLFCGTVQDYPTLEDDRSTMGESSMAISLPVGLAARVLCSLRWPWGMEPNLRTVSQPLSSRDFNVSLVDGPGVIDDRTRISGTAVGTAMLRVEYAPEGTSLRGPTTTTSVRFVGEAPAEGISLSRRYQPWQVSTLRVGSEPALPPYDPNGSGGITYLESGSSQQLVLVSWHAINTTERYFREIPFAQVMSRWTAGTPVASLDANGRLTWSAPGVSGLFLTAEGFVQPILVAARFPSTSRVSLRAAPDSISLMPMRNTPTCVDLSMFVSIDGTERAMTEIETHTLRRYMDIQSMFPRSLEDAVNRSATRFCIDGPQRFMGEPAVSSGTVLLNWIQAPSDLNASLRVPYSIRWP